MPRARKRPKAGTNEEAARQRRERFVDAYFLNNMNLTATMKHLGYSAKTAGSQGSRMLADVEIMRLVRERSDALTKSQALTVEEVMASMARALRFDPGKMYGADGALLPVSQMPDEVRLELEGMDVKEVTKSAGKGKARVLLAVATAKVDFPKKHAARDQAMRHFGLFAKDKAGAARPEDSDPPPAVAVTIDFKDARRRPPGR